MSRQPGKAGAVAAIGDHLRWYLALGLVATAAAIPAVAFDRDRTADLAAVFADIERWSAAGLAAFTVPVLGLLAVTCAAHYAAAAAVSRAAAGTRLPWRELVGAQLAASAANRLTPAGLGGAGLLGRYLTKRGRLTPAQATAAVSATALLGGVADVLAFGALIGFGTLFGVAGARTEVPLLGSRLLHLVPIPTGAWLVLPALALVTVATIALTPRLRRSAATRRAVLGTSAVRRSLLELAASPARMAVLMSASAATTLVLAAGFTVAAALGPVQLASSSCGAVLIGYLVAAAAGNALPTPGGIGTADAAFVGVLLTAGASATTAVPTVLVFRLATYWAPAVLGAVTVRLLRRRGVL